MQGLLHSFTRRVELSARDTSVRIAAYMAIAILVFLALISFIAAAAIKIAEIYGAAVAALCAGGFFLLAAIVFGLIAQHRARVQRRRMMMEMAALQRQASVNVAGTVLPIMLRGSPIGTLALVAGASFLLVRGLGRK